MEFYIFIVALTVFITTLVMTGVTKKYVVSQETDANYTQDTPNTQMGSSSMQDTPNTQMGSSSMQDTPNTQMGSSSTQDASRMQMGSSSTQTAKESFSYDNTAPLFIESKNPEDYIGDNRIYNPRPGFS
jgi:hypothetical protein